jgi:hypothetical protein
MHSPLTGFTVDGQHSHIYRMDVMKRELKIKESKLVLNENSSINDDECEEQSDGERISHDQTRDSASDCDDVYHDTAVADKTIQSHSKYQMMVIHPGSDSMPCQRISGDLHRRNVLRLKHSVQDEKIDDLMKPLATIHKFVPQLSAVIREDVENENDGDIASGMNSRQMSSVSLCEAIPPSSALSSAGYVYDEPNQDFIGTDEINFMPSMQMLQQDAPQQPNVEFESRKFTAAEENKTIKKNYIPTIKYEPNHIIVTKKNIGSSNEECDEYQEINDDEVLLQLEKEAKKVIKKDTFYVTSELLNIKAAEKASRSRDNVNLKVKRLSRLIQDVNVTDNITHNQMGSHVFEDNRIYAHQHQVLPSSPRKVVKSASRTSSPSRNNEDASVTDDKTMTTETLIVDKCKNSHNTSTMDEPIQLNANVLSYRISSNPLKQYLKSEEEELKWKQFYESLSSSSSRYDPLLLTSDRATLNERPFLTLNESNHSPRRTINKSSQQHKHPNHILRKQSLMGKVRTARLLRIKNREKTLQNERNKQKLNRQNYRNDYLKRLEEDRKDSLGRKLRGYSVRPNDSTFIKSFIAERVSLSNISDVKKIQSGNSDSDSDDLFTSNPSTPRSGRSDSSRSRSPRSESTPLAKFMAGRKISEYAIPLNIESLRHIVADAGLEGIDTFESDQLT